MHSDDVHKHYRLRSLQPQQPSSLQDGLEGSCLQINIEENGGLYHTWEMECILTPEAAMVKYRTDKNLKPGLAHDDTLIKIWA